MRGPDERQAILFSYRSIEDRIPADHPLRALRRLVDPLLGKLSPRFQRLDSAIGRPSIPPEQLLRALLLQVLYTIRSERQLMEQLDYNLLYRWFVGLTPDDAVWDPTVFTKKPGPAAGGRHRRGVRPPGAGPGLHPARQSQSPSLPSAQHGGWADDAPPGVRGESTQTQAGRRRLRLAQVGGIAPEAPSSGPGQGGVGLCLHECGIQFGAAAVPARGSCDVSPPPPTGAGRVAGPAEPDTTRPSTARPDDPPRHPGTYSLSRPLFPRPVRRRSPRAGVMERAPGSASKRPGLVDNVRLRNEGDAGSEPQLGIS